MRGAAMLLLVAVYPACAVHRGPDDPLAHLRLGGDAAFDLADDQDLNLERAAFTALPAEAPERAAVRRRLGDEYARRLGAALAHGDHDGGHAALRSLLSLWSAEELRRPERVGRELAPYRSVLLVARAAFARAGRDREAAVALAALLLADPAGAAAHRDELNEIFEYGDELALAEGRGVIPGTRAIEILERLIEVHPAPWAVDRLVALYLERQTAFESRQRAGNPAVRDDGAPLFRTAWNVTRVLACGGRIGEAAAAIARLSAAGDDRGLHDRLRRALAASGGPHDWVLLAARFQASDPAHGDSPAAALAIAREAIHRFPRAAAAHLVAADSARRLDEEELAIRYYESGLALEPDHPAATSELGRLYVLRLSSLAASDRPAAASRLLVAFDRFHRAATAALGRSFEPDLADAQAALGRALVSLGQLDEAQRLLTTSLERRQNLDALESLGTMALKRDRFDVAVTYFEQALARPEETVLLRFQQCRLMRLSAEANEGAGRTEPARARYHAALEAWRDLMEERLPAPFAAEALVEQGKILWQLGERDMAMAAFDAAVDIDPNGASIHADVVAFLIMGNQFDRALDAYHRALGSHEIGDYFKVYMSLWVMAEAHRQGLPVDPLATDFLAGRDGTLWYDDLARYAAGRLPVADLEKRATTRARRAELLYYRAVLGSDVRQDPEQARRLLEGVLETGMVQFFEYDMAKHWLRHGFGIPERN